MKRLSVTSLTTLALCVFLLGGCGFFARFGLDKQVAAVEEAKQQAVVVEANRFAAASFRQAEESYRSANELKDQGRYKEAKEALALAQQQYQQAAQMAPLGRQAFEQSLTQITQSLDETGGLLEQARQAGAEAMAPELVSAARQAFLVAVSAVAAATAAPMLEPAGLVDLTTPGGVIDTARSMAGNLLRATLATQVAQASAEMGILWDNLEKSGARASQPDEVGELDGLRNQLLQALADEDFPGFLSAYAPFRERTLALVKGVYEVRVSTAMREAETALERARALGGDEHAAEPFQAASQALEEARAALERGDYNEALGKAQTSSEESRAAVRRMEQEVDSLLTSARRFLEIGRQVDALRVRAELFNAGQAALRSADEARAAGQTEVLVSQARRAEVNLRQAVEETRQLRTTEILDESQARLERLTGHDAARLASEQLTAAEDALRQLAGKDAQEEFEAILAGERGVKEALDRLEMVLREDTQKHTHAAQALVEKAEKADEGRYAPEAAANARRVFERAVSALRGGDYSAAVAAAGEAATLAEQAAAAATLARTREQIELARGEAAEAEKAAAAVYAAPLLEAGQVALASAQALLNEGSGEEALEAATLAHESFTSARRFKLAAAEAAQRDAEISEAPMRRPEAFAAAGQTLAAAQAAMQQRDYSRANTLADQATAQFATVESDSWELRVAEMAPEVESEMLFLTDNLGAQYARTHFRPTLDGLLEMRGNRSVGLNKAAYEAGRQALESAGLARAELADSLETVAAREEARLAGLVEIIRDEPGLLKAEGARQAGRLAQVARREGAFKESFLAYENLAAALDKAIEDVVAHNRQLMYAQHKANLDSWRTTGAEPLAQPTFNALAEQIDSLLVGPNTLEEYQRVAGVDQQVEAELDVLEETIRLSTEQMLAETRSNLESAAQEGAGRIFPTHFARAEEAWRFAGDLPKGRNYPEVAEAVVKANAMSRQLLDVVRLFQEEDKYRAAAYDLINNANNLLKKFAYVIEVGPHGWRTAQSSHRADLFAGVQRIISASEFYIVALTLERRAKEITPPPTQVDLHRLVVQSFEQLTLTGDLFQKYGDYTYGTEARRRFIEAAFVHYHRREKLMLEVDRRMLEGSRVEEAFRYDQPTLIRRADGFLTRLQEKSRGLEKKIGEWIWGYEL